MTIDSAYGVRRRWSLAVSLGLHAGLLLWLSLLRSSVAGPEGIVEIAWVDAGSASAVAALPAATAPEIIPPEPPPATRPATPVPERPAPPAHFEREAPSAETAPRPQTIEARDDRIHDRLASLQQASRRPGLEVQTPASTVAASRMAEAPAPESIGGGGGAGLTRGESQAPVATPLRRGSPGSSSNGRTAVLAAAPAPITTERPAAAVVTDSTAVRQLAGASLMGPVADRPLQSHAVPVYPDWAKREAIEASVSLTFVVLPDGSIKDGILVQRTSGFRDFDDNAVDALRTWQFAPLTRGATGEQWGAITFNYRLSDRPGR